MKVKKAAKEPTLKAQIRGINRRIDKLSDTIAWAREYNTVKLDERLKEIEVSIKPFKIALIERESRLGEAMHGILLDIRAFRQELAEMKKKIDAA